MISSFLVIPVFTDEPADMNVTRTEPLVLNCSANGFPRPEIVWLHNETALENTSGIIITETFSDEVDITSTLSVMSISFNNSGNYTCIARSPVFDDVMSRLALVLIQGKFPPLYSYQDIVIVCFVCTSGISSPS